MNDLTFRRSGGFGWAVWLALLAAAAPGGCARKRPRPLPSPPHATPPSAGALDLPEVAGFVAGPPAPGDGFVRRTYARGRARVQVTLARLPMSAGDYQRWVAASASFPQADLGLAGGDANGFYQCAEGDDDRCDLLVQLRAGLHLELRAGGSATRADVDTLARGLPLRAWAGGP